MLLPALLLAGCLHRAPPLHEPVNQIALPLWFTRPPKSEQALVPVDLNMRLPDALTALATAFELPGWVVYGVVRGLGAGEFLANGTFKRFTLSDAQGESSVVADSVVYDVDGGRVRQELNRIATACREAGNELERRHVLGRHVHRRFGGYILFGMVMKPAGSDNLLLTDGIAEDPMEVFTRDCAPDFPALGWQETAADYIETHAGPFAYGSPVEAFRRTEEEAIRELAKTLLMKFSHMSRDAVSSEQSAGGDYREDVIREEVRLRLRGVRVLRRAVDLERNLCIVQVAVGRSDVSRR